jgi:hypothetical protein
MSERRDYQILITVNDLLINKVIIDDHYQAKHSDSINDELIIELVKMLDGQFFSPEAENDGFKYFKTEPLSLNGSNYRLIWLLEEHEIYIGIVNAFRR